MLKECKQCQKIAAGRKNAKKKEYHVKEKS
jgi:hypothetical protein